MYIISISIHFRNSNGKLKFKIEIRKTKTKIRKKKIEQTLNEEKLLKVNQNNYYENSHRERNRKKIHQQFP